MRALIVCFTFLINVVAWSQNSQAIIDKALQAYDTKEYATSIDLWNQVLKEYPNQADAHFNIANAYYQNRQAGWSIYHYEKALKINPDLKDARVNLEYAQKLRIDNFKGIFAISQDEMFYNIFDFLSANGWAVVSIIISILVLTAFMIYYFTQETKWKKTGFSLIFVFLGLMILSVAITFHQTNFLNKSRFGIVVQKEVLMKEQPRSTSKTVLKIHEGSKAVIDDRSEQWVQIRLVNDTIGWVKKEEIKEL